jgi:hypothetical protein
MDEAGEIQFELVAVSLGIGTLDFAELALETLIHDFLGFRSCDFSDIAAMFVVNEGEETWKAVAVFETKAAAVADLERSPYLFIQRICVPIFSF